MNGINLVPNHYNKAYQRKWMIGLGALGVLLVTTVLIVLAFVPINQIKKEEQRLAELNQKLASVELEEVKEVLEDIQNMNTQKQSIQKTVEAIDLPENITKRTMDMIINGAPRGLRMNEILIESMEATVSINGQAEQIKSVAEYVVYLHNTGAFENITYSTQKSEDLDVEQQFEYRIQLQIKSLQEEAEELEQAEETLEDLGGEEW